ncbi:MULTISPECIES: amidohydrolase family protein [unclassified Microbacterium]|uniref:amidohydrolase family protein n=1 Tax=unclassified Microbacterium TaxID=2609290 RepID=UPI00214CB1A7|nr:MULTISPECIES: amidohydrolase family protein [unclassified Microbacterium]MCR2808398.1 amidohydrolase [Microbacterium sp. zg.B185]WIM19156.1 amidohydrolase family protein [Microbacterium sp. zg-B185]
MTIIDVHAHVLPKDYPVGEAFPRTAPIDGDSAREVFFGAFHYRAEDIWFDVERRIEAMDGRGVDEEVISPMPPLLNYSLDLEAGTTLFRHINESIAGYVAAGGGRIHGLGTVPLQDPDAAAAELTHIAELGLRGAEIPSHVNGKPIGEPEFYPVFEEAERLGLGLFVHTLPRAEELGIHPDYRGSLGVGIEATRGAASIAFGGLADRCALDNLLFSHAAGGLPAFLPRADFFWSQAPEDQRTAEPPSAIARRFSYDSMVFDPAGMRFIIEYLGADRIMLGTDFPAMPRPMPMASLLDGLGLNDHDRELISSANARRFLSQSAAAV